MKLPGDKQRGIDPDMPDAGGRAGKTRPEEDSVI